MRAKREWSSSLHCSNIHKMAQERAAYARQSRPMKYNSAVTNRRMSISVILAVLSLLVNLVWVFAIQPFLAPDEPEHLATVREVQRRHILPEIHFDFTTNPRGTPVPPFDDQPLFDAIQEVLGTGDRHQISFESAQAPVYYVTAALVSWPVSDNVLLQLYVCRIVSAIFGMLTVLFTWATIRQISPNSPQLALFCATTVLFLPQFTFNSAYVTNDVALSAVGAAALYVWFKGLRDPAFDRYLIFAGALTGFAVLTKLTALVMLPPLALIAILRSKSVRHFFVLAAGAAAAFLLVTGWWFVRNVVVYGEWTGFANAIRYHQSRKSFVVLDPTNMNALGQFLKTTFDSSIGVFGWMDVFLDSAIYQIALVIWAFLGLLSLYWLFRRIREGSDRRSVLRSTSVLFLLGGGILFGYFTYSVQIGYQAQGLYLFLLLIPCALLINYGHQRLVDRRSWRKLWYGLPTLLLLALNIYSLVVVATHWFEISAL